MEMISSSQDPSVSSSEESFTKLPDKAPSNCLTDLVVRHLVESALIQNAKDGSQGDEAPGIAVGDGGGSEAEGESRFSKAFPWYPQFNKMCRMEIGTTNINTLENLMTVYLHHVESCVNECYPKPNRAAKLKKCMNDTLLLFHMIYSDIKKPLEHSSYLDKMSDLMAIYMDMEIKASRRGKESLPKIASKLTSSLYIFLDRSQDHILDSILKTKYMNKNFWELCVLIFSRVLRDSPGRAVYEMTFVRYILVFKMWKRVVRGPEEKRKVMKLATVRLFPPSQFREKLKAGLLSGVLPKIPKSRKDITMFLMQAKFCVKEKIKAFLKAVADPKQQGVLGSQLAADLDRPLFFDDDVETSHNSNSDEQDDINGSCTLMNDIWSSMTSELGITHHLRIASVVTAKTKKQVKNKIRKNVVKNKGIATPVFKTDPGLTDSNDACEKLKKKKKKQLLQQPEKEPEESKDKLDTNLSKTADTFEKSSEVLEVKNVPPEPVAVEKKVEIEVCSSEDIDKPKDIPVKPNTHVAVVEKIIGEVEPPKVTNEVSVSSIKVEPESDDVCVIGFVNSKDKEQVNQVDSVCQGDKENEMLEVAEEVEIRCDSDSVVAEPSAPAPPCQQAVVSSVKVENSATPAENAEGQSSHVRDVFLYDEQTPTEWSPAHPQGYYNNTVDLISEYFVHNKLPEFNTDSAANDLEQRNIYEIFEMAKSLNIRPKENLFQMREDNGLGDLSSVPIEDEVSDANTDRAFASHSGSGTDTKGAFIQPQVPPREDMNLNPYQLEKQRELNQKLIDECLESMHEQGRYSDKTLGKNQRAAADVSKVVADVQAESKEKGIFKRPAVVSRVDNRQAIIGGKKAKKRYPAKQKTPVTSRGEVAKHSRRAMRSSKKKVSPKEEEVNLVGAKAKGKVKKKNSSSPISDENRADWKLPQNYLQNI